MSEKDPSMYEEALLVADPKPEISVEKIEQFENGFGFGNPEGISFKSRLSDVGQEVLAEVEAVINSKGILIPISKDKNGEPVQDDGCSDGRSVWKIFHGLMEKTKSLIRAKVFGGGATMVTAMEIGSGNAKGKRLNDLFRSSISVMEQKRIDFGAHTDENIHGDKCGCGAIDNAPLIISNVVKFKSQIRLALKGLAVDTTGLDNVLGNFEDYAEEIAGQPYSGKEVIDDITNEGKIVKQLTDRHREMFFLFNTVEGYTVDQELIRNVSKGKVQVFAVDVWRLQQLAVLRHPDDPAAQNEAFLSELVYSLGVSATLTAGDLPVRILTKKDVVMAA